MEGLGLSIVLYIVGLIILYIIIETAVRRGINNSIVGQYLEKKYGVKDIRKNKKSFLDDDLDKD
ncbi:DUF6019 family protein [Alkalihalobacillus sp. LMS39]|uniref:DUF6019 family protein n=1 Tax=Alkalihalobacillus sp. LMS39 TaxID=2924032 RepID=UPI001FB3CE45|nr:DUF6019 family protein [Alkalihalobacillus sp. LMS39]UOE95225.1 DUF6019 family protein [Alkalihalobacillus sp. LMS39]